MRVQGQEYGPVEVDELREWKREGRLIRENEVREPDSERWFPAGELPEIFADEGSHPELAARESLGRAQLGAIFARSWQLYRQGFAHSSPSLRWSACPGRFPSIRVPYLELRSRRRVTPIDRRTRWPVVQFLHDRGYVYRLADFLSPVCSFSPRSCCTGATRLWRSCIPGAKPLWTRMAPLCVLSFTGVISLDVLPVLAFALLATGRGTVREPRSVIFLAWPC